MALREMAQAPAQGPTVGGAGTLSRRPHLSRRLAPELRFIIEFCGPGGDLVEARGLDWGHVAAGLERHGLTRLIPSMLARPGLVPPAEVERLRGIQRDQAAATLAQVAEVTRVCALLEQAGVRYLLIKGVALSIQLYGRPGVRSSKDIDILIEPGSFLRVDAILRSLGYSRPKASLAADELPGFVAKETGYLNPQRGMMIEVHSRLTENPALYPAEFEAVWQSRESVALGGRSLPAMPRKGLAAYLCAHGAGHCWARLMWLLDIAPLTDSPEAIDAALADARRLGLEPVLLHALWMLHHWFGHAVPSRVLARAQASRSVRILNRAAAIFHADRRWYEQAPRHSWRRFFQYSVLGRIAGYSMKPQARYWRMQLSLDLVSPADRTLVALPPGFGWGYVLLRPFGWLIRRLRR